MKIAVDVMGTDYGPKELVLGAVNAVKEYGCETVLVGDEKIIRELLVKYGADKNPKITIHHASEVIAMDEHPAIAVKSKKDASIVVAAGLQDCLETRNVMPLFPPAAPVLPLPQRFFA